MKVTDCQLSVWWSNEMRRVLLVLCLVMVSSTLSAYDFPAPGGKITSSFGSSVKGEFNTGIDIQTENVFASEAGEVLYCSADFIAIAHRDSILTLYSHVNVPESFSKEIQIKKGQLLGKTKSGTLHFAVYDLEMERYINPLLMTEDIKKSELPRVQGISYDESQSLLNVQIPYKGLLGLYRVQIYAGGQMVGSLGFRTIQRKGETLMLDSEGFTHSSLYGREGAFSFPGIHLSPGVNNIDVIVSDFYGKKVEFHGRITI